ncbi:MAG TPA: hypothetical protein PKG78_02255 [Candidatus Woesebacteria bacterium]|nr:hypothetical protein [Candidatus Woesebacteria bacterium]
MIKSSNKQLLADFKKNKNLQQINDLVKSFLLVLWCLVLSLGAVFAQSVPAVFAQSTPAIPDVNGEIKVTARMPDIVAPSTPILINPEDGANLDNAHPVFQWYESTDNQAMYYYQFILDGHVWFDNIPLTDFANDDYSLDYDAALGIYTLVAKDPLAHGSHSWRIVAWDYGDNSASSTTWVFHIFTEDPNFTIKKIGDVNVNISAANPDSVPVTAISLFALDPLANEPWIIALGDANLKVDLVVTIPNRASQFYSQYTDGDGNWALQLSILPRNQIIRLDFNISDVVGHVSYIRNLFIIIQQHYWPPTPIPTMTKPPLTGFPSTILPSGTIYPSDTVQPSGIQPSQVPVTPLPSPGIKIPIIPPKEIVHEVVEEVKASLPTRIATLLTELSRSPIWNFLAQFFALFLALLVPLVTYILVLLKFYQDLSLTTLKKVFIALWPWSQRRQHLVFEYHDSQAAPLVRIELLDAANKEVLDWQISNYLGQFSSFAWPSQPVVLKVKDNNFYYPIGIDKPSYLRWENFYQSEAFVVGKNDHQPTAASFDPKRSLAIPTLMAQGKNNLPFIERIRIILAYLLTYPWWFWALSLVVVLPFALRYPSIWNYLALLYYLAIALGKYLYRRGSTIWQFRVVSSNGYQLNQNVILIINDLTQGFSQALVVAVQESASPKLHLLKSDFVFSLQARDYAFWDGQRVISETEYKVNSEVIDEFKLHRINDANRSLKLLQPHCQLMLRQ